MFNDNLRFRYKQNKRVSQQGILPTAVKQRNLGDVVSKTVLSVNATTIPNNDRVVLDVTLDAKEGTGLLAEVFVSVYVGSVATSNSLLDAGSNVDYNNWIIVGPHYNWRRWDSTTDQTTVSLVTHNNTGSSQDVIFRIQAKYVSNNPNAV